MTWRRNRESSYRRALNTATFTAPAVVVLLPMAAEKEEEEKDDDDDDEEEEEGKEEEACDEDEEGLAFDSSSFPCLRFLPLLRRRRFFFFVFVVVVVFIIGFSDDESSFSPSSFFSSSTTTTAPTQPSLLVPLAASLFSSYSGTFTSGRGFWSSSTSTPSSSPLADALETTVFISKKKMVFLFLFNHDTTPFTPPPRREVSGGRVRGRLDDCRARA